MNIGRATVSPKKLTSHSTNYQDQSLTRLFTKRWKLIAILRNIPIIANFGPRSVDTSRQHSALCRAHNRCCQRAGFHIKNKIGRSRASFGRSFRRQLAVAFGQSRQGCLHPCVSSNRQHCRPRNRRALPIGNATDLYGGGHSYFLFLSYPAADARPFNLQHGCVRRRTGFRSLSTVPVRSS